MIYGSKTLPMKVADNQRLKRAERMMVRHMCGVILKDKMSCGELRQRVNIDDVSDVLRRSKLRWFGHVERKIDGDCVIACQRQEVAGGRGRGRGKKR
jgi:hypothetical protein